MSRLLVRVAITAVALLAAALLVPGIRVAWGDEPAGAVMVLAGLAAVFGVIDGFLRPVTRTAGLPLKVLTFGLFAVLVNTGLLLLVAGVVDTSWDRLLVIGGYPPDLSLGAVATAALGSFIITVVTTVLSLLIPEV